MGVPIDEHPQLRPAAAKLLAALDGAQGQPRSGVQLARWVADRYGVQLAPTTVRVQLGQLRARGLARPVDTAGERQWVAGAAPAEAEQVLPAPATSATVKAAPGDPDAVPVVPVAMVEGRGERERWAVWCVYCDAGHIHAPGAGLRLAGCRRGTYVIAEPLRSTR